MCPEEVIFVMSKYSKSVEKYAKIGCGQCCRLSDRMELYRDHVEWSTCRRSIMYCHAGE